MRSNELEPAFHITITLKDGRLYGRATGQHEFALLPASETRFFLKSADAEITFHVDADSVATDLTLHQHKSRSGRKID